MILGTRATSLYLQREILLVGQLYASWPTRTYSVQIPPTKKTSRPTLGSQLQVMSQPSSSNFRDLQLLSTRLSLPLCISPLNPSNLEGRSMFLAAPISSNTFTATPLLRLLGRSAPLLLSANAQVVVVRRWKVTYTSPNIGRSRLWSRMHIIPTQRVSNDNGSTVENPGPTQRQCYSQNTPVAQPTT